MGLDYTTGAPVMMQLGGFQFGITTAAFQTLQRTNEWRWPSQDRFGKPPVLQHVGQGAETITLPGVIYPEFRGGFGQLDAMRAQADKGEPLPMIDGGGSALGLWAIERIEEKQAVFAAGAAPRKVEFTLQLRRFYPTEEGGLASGGLSLAGIAAAASKLTTSNFVAVPEGAVGEVEQTSGLADSVAGSAKDLLATASKAYEDMKDKVAPYASQVKDAAGAALRCVDCASQLQATALQAKSIVAMNPVSAVALSSAQTMGFRASALQVQAGSASTLLRNATAKLEGIANVPADTIQSVRVAAACAEKTATLCRQTAGEAAKITGVATA